MSEAGFTSREVEITNLVTRAFPDRTVSASIIALENMGGKEEKTLRLTVDEAYSSELPRERVANGDETPESLAKSIEADIRTQLGIG